MIYALVVVYNQKCEDSQTICSIMNSPSRGEMRCIVFDNSTRDYGNADFCQRHHYTYYSLGDNVGLSRAYNHVIDRLKGEDGYLLVLDDDTELSEAFFQEVDAIARRGEPGIFIPVVRAGDYLLSPSLVKFNSGCATLKSLDELKMDRITAINSGMLVNLRVYDRIRYNEGLFLDCVDHAFMRDARLNGIPITVMQSTIEQHYSRNEKGELAPALKRFSIYRRDFRKYAALCHGMPFYYASMLKLRLGNCVKYRTTAFLHD